MQNYHILEGNISIKAALMAKRRTFEKIIVDEHKKDRDTNYILKEATLRNIPIELLKREKIDELAEGKTHGGMIAYVGDRTYDVLPTLENDQPCFLAILEGIEDPFNFGYILRSLYAAGCEGVILSPRNWSTAAKVVAKSSAGASEYIPMIIAEEMQDICEELKQQDFTIVCGQRKDATSLYEYTFPKRVCIAIGGEMRGLSKAVQGISDQNIFIPYENEFRNSLNAASATSVIAFEYLRQKLKP